METGVKPAARLGERVSIVMPTRNRPGFLYRALSYYAGRTEKPHLVIADSSSPPHLAINQRIIDHFFTQVNLEYHVYPETTLPVDKFQFAVEKVQTPYSVLSGDDDFLVPAALQEAAQFLDTHPDTSGVSGKSYYFTMPLGKVFGGITQLGGYRQQAVKETNGRERLKHYLAGYLPNSYAVQHTAAFAGNWAVMPGKIHDLAFAELIPACLVVLQGKTACLDRLFMLRQADTEKLYPSSGFFEWLTLENWPAEYRFFEDTLAEKLCGVDCIDLAEARKSVGSAFALYLADFFANSLPRKDAARFLPFLLPNRLALWCANKMAGISIALDFNNPLSQFRRDFKPIRQVICTSPPAWLEGN